MADKLGLSSITQRYNFQSPQSPVLPGTQLKSATPTRVEYMFDTCKREKPNNILERGLYNTGEIIKEYKGKITDWARPATERANDSVSIWSNLSEVKYAAKNLAFEGLKKAGTVFNVITGLGDAAVAYKDGVDRCYDSWFDFKYTLAKSATQSVVSSAAGVGSAVGVGALLASTPVTLPTFALTAVGVGGAYLAGKGIDAAFEYARPYFD